MEIPINCSKYKPYSQLHNVKTLNLSNERLCSIVISECPRYNINAERSRNKMFPILISCKLGVAKLDWIEYIKYKGLFTNDSR